MKILLTVACTLIAAVTLAADKVIYPTGTPTIAHFTDGTCPGEYWATLTYALPISQGWGWHPDTNNTTLFVVTDTNRSDTHIRATGKKGDVSCNLTTVIVPYPNYSDSYRFVVFFPSTNGLPSTTNYPLVLNGWQ